MSGSNRTRSSNVPSNLISKPENDVLFRILGRGCSTLASGVVQLFLADSSERTSWRKHGAGVVCFVKDNNKRSYFIRVFDLKKQQMLWEQELYTQFRYKSPRDFFHTFEADNYQAGLNFSSEDEAKSFKTAVETKLSERRERKQKRTERRKNSTGVRPPIPNSAPPQLPSPKSPGPVISVDVPDKSRKNSTKRKDKDKKGGSKMTKADISTPTDFRHLSHVGWDPEKGFNMDNLQPDMKMLFKSVGIKPDTQVDKETIDFIYDFVGRNGGLEAVRKEMEGEPAPPIPPNRAPPPMIRPSVATPPPPPNRPSGRGQTRPLPSPPGRPSAPPTPPRSPKFQRSRPAPIATNQMPVSASPKSLGGAPIPPPPAPPVPPPAPAAPQIITPPEPSPTSSDSGGGRGDLLKDLLKGGVHLKKVEATAQAEKPSPQDDGIVGALRNALVERQKHIHGNYDDDEDDDDEIDDDEWDDD